MSGLWAEKEGKRGGEIIGKLGHEETRAEGVVNGIPRADLGSEEN